MGSNGSFIEHRTTEHAAMLLPPSTQPDDGSGDERKGKHNVAPVVVRKGTTVRGQVRRIQPSPSELNTEVKNNIGKLCVGVYFT